jgi:hypothetical protein
MAQTLTQPLRVPGSGLAPGPSHVAPTGSASLGTPAGWFFRTLGLGLGIVMVWKIVHLLAWHCLLHVLHVSVYVCASVLCQPGLQRATR